jgi:hypothetical protein
MAGSSGRLLIVAVAMTAAFVCKAQTLQSVETDDLRLIYFDPIETYLVPRVIQTYHDSLDRQKSILGYRPSGKTTVLLTDFADYGNAGASAVPADSIVVDIAPLPFTFETTAPAERMYTIMNHEMVHVATMDQAGPSDSAWRRFFRGKVLATDEHPETLVYQYLTAPRVLSPRWFLEGLAVFQETWMAGGLGRSQGGFDEMVFRSKVRDGARFYDPLGLVAEGVKVDFQVGANAYLYGERFMSYIAWQYSPAKLVEWAARSEDGERNYKDEFARVFGLRLDEAWQDWVEFEHQFQAHNLEVIRQYPTTAYEPLTDAALGSVSRAFYDPAHDSLIAAVRYPGVVAYIGEYSIAGRHMDRIQDIKVPMLYKVSSVAYDAASRTVFYTADNYAWRDLMAVNLDTRETRMLLRDERIGEIAFNPADRSIWGARHLNGYVSIVRVPYPYDEWQLVKALPYGEVAYDLDVSPDGTLLSGSFGDLQGNQALEVYSTADLLQGEAAPVSTLELGQAVPEGFVFSPDGRYLFGSAYYTGVSNIFRYEIPSAEFEAVSNTESGFFRPVPVDDDELIVFHYTGEGFVPVRIRATPVPDVAAIRFFGTDIVDRYPELASWRSGSPDAMPAESRIVSQQEYVPARHMRLESVYPTVLGYKDSASLGLKAIYSDPIRLDVLAIGGAYSIDSGLPAAERPNLSIDYRHTVFKATPLSGTWSMGARLNHADFYDLFGPTRNSRKGQRYYIGYEKTLLFDEPKRLTFATELNHYADMDALPRYQNVSVTFDKLSTFDAALSYEHVRRSLGAVDDEKGFRWKLAGSASYVDGDTIPEIHGDIDFGFALPWKHSSLWIRNALGAAFGEPEDEFANFYFGGFGNNYVDHGEAKRYREYYAMPGFDLNAIPGRNFYRGMIEWNLPPLRFNRVGTDNFYLSWARPALFANALVTNADRSDLKYNARSFGLQVDFQFTVMARYEMMLSTGYARGYGEGTFSDDEIMVSLKIM